MDLDFCQSRCLAGARNRWRLKPATPRYPNRLLRLLPSGPDRVHNLSSPRGPALAAIVISGWQSTTPASGLAETPHRGPTAAIRSAIEAWVRCAPRAAGLPFAVHRRAAPGASELHGAHHEHADTISRRGVRAVEGARLEIVYTAKPYRGFDSLPLRQFTNRMGPLFRGPILFVNQ